MIEGRQYSMFELRQILHQKETEITRLKKEKETMRNDMIQLRNWNYYWQKHRWSEAMTDKCEDLEREFKGLSNIQTRILEYLSGTQDGTARHIRAVARALFISPSTAHANLRILAQKRLIRCYLRQSHLRKYYCLPDAQKLVQTALRP